MSVVAASRGYPGKYATGVPITGIEKADALPDVKVFQAGTKFDADGKRVLTDGGRVLSVCALGKDVADAQRRAYEAIRHVQFEGMHYRKDIGHHALR
jgi:phosphoribosylamine--glycine ligase